MSKRPLEHDDELKFVALGGGSEVGRSCHVLMYKGKTIMLDAGVHPAYSGMASLPFYDEFDLSTVDILLISHFHLDHAASLPYVMQHTNFRGRVFMTHPTKAIYRWLLSDFVRVSGGAGASNADLYSDDDLSASFERIEAIDFYSTLEVGGIRFTAYHAGHVLGAAMYMIEIGGTKVLFTGDYSREQDRHLHSAAAPPEKPDVLICESTYGTGVHQPRLEKERRLTTLIHSTLNKGGRCLLPVFALGRAQEILLILDEYWQKHPDLDGITIYYASSLARKCMAVYQTFINMMNEQLLKRYRETKVNPFHFKHVRSIRSLDKFTDLGPSVVLASPGMLQNGVSRHLLERWAPDPRNALIITGYSVEGTMAKQLLNEPMDFPSLQTPDVRIPRRMSVEELSFAAHVDFKENTSFIDEVGAPHVILVHGETNNMGRLKSALLSKYAPRRGTPQEVRVYSPRNCVEVSLHFKAPKLAKTLGALAVAALNPNPDGSDGPATVSGVLVQKDFKLSLVSVADLREYTGLTTSTIMERQSLVVDAGPDLVNFHLVNMFGDVEHTAESEEDGQSENGTATAASSASSKVSDRWRILNAVGVTCAGNVYAVEWEAGNISDAIADAVIAVLLGVDSSKASVKLSSKQHAHSHEPAAVKTDRVQSIAALLRPQFGDSLRVADDRESATIDIDGTVATVKFADLSVECPNPALRQRVAHVLDLSASIAAPLA